MPQPIQLALAMLVGFALGVLFYGGLWLTVRALPRSRHPVALTLGSYWARAASVAAGFAVVASGGWWSALAALLGFIAARLALARRFPAQRARDGA